MIRARMLATAILFNDNDMLMMKRSPHRTLSPGMWAAVGGHMEPHEIGDPQAAVLREIHEETGLLPDEIHDLHLQYILIRLNQSEVRQQFIYTATTGRRDISQSEEGELFWIPRDQVLDREIPFIFRQLLEHYFRMGPSDAIRVGTAGYDEAGSPVVHWTELIDPRQL